MNEHQELAACPVCGRPIRRRVYSYTLGRKDSMPYRMLSKWWHEHDLSDACEQPDA